MKRFSSLVILSCALLIAGCSVLQFGAKPSVSDELQSTDEVKIVHASDPHVDRTTIRDPAGPVVLERVAFRHGVSSVTVERLARRFGCAGGNGAGLITEKGPVEVYRMQCDNGAAFLARCELRQCRPMR